ncbi:hypothetical protein B0T10DRAFT_461443 [Thelonectria olida]|uniref:Rhodopsin domain-containing protein n=1 Tax=Thelonectria olida TaxID=1576542 RepID=A0A9P8W3U1_9HYPO|nr:hypothetical protein B0T10DRAFT_461443 [Thelonectria olida]
MAGLTANIYVSTGITWVAAFVALVMRIIARRIMKITWWFDDYFCILAFNVWTDLLPSSLLPSLPRGAFIVANWCFIGTMHWSLGQYMPDSLDAAAREEILHNSRFLGFLNSLAYALSIASSKLAILFLYWRIFSISTIRIPIQIMIVLSVMWIILRTFMVIFRCIPVQAYWDKTIPHAACRIKDTEFFFGTVLTHMLMDVAILVLPIFEVFRLRLRLGQKLAIAALFIVGAMQVHPFTFKTTQMPHDYGMYCVWGTVEINIAIVSACFPLLRPIFSRILPARFLSTADNTQPISRPSNAIRLTTISRTTREKEHDETSSTHQLADPEGSVSNMSDLDPVNMHGPEGVHTVISSRCTGPYGGEGQGMNGIHVYHDTIVQVEETELNKAFRR